jgi:ubiquinone/menaquinone biosynthesis C-methylase UbiE
MTTGAEKNDQLGRVRDRFTRTAEQFSEFALTTRAAEAHRLVELAAPRGSELALDLACGPGTFAREFAPHVRFILGMDFTPAMLAQAKRAAAEAGLLNMAFARADASALPVADAALDLATCGYALHHFADFARAVTELGRVVRRGGRVAVVDLIVPDGADAEFNNRIERARDASHTRTLTRSEIVTLLEAAGLRILANEIGERPRDFDDWMRVAGCAPGDPAHEETRRLMLESLPGDLAGFHPRLAPGASEGGPPKLEYTQTSLFVVGEKL